MWLCPYPRAPGPSQKVVRPPWHPPQPSSQEVVGALAIRGLVRPGMQGLLGRLDRPVGLQAVTGPSSGSTWVRAGLRWVRKVVEEDTFSQVYSPAN